MLSDGANTSHGLQLCKYWCYNGATLLMGSNYVSTDAIMELRFSWASIMYVLVLQWSCASHGLQLCKYWCYNGAALLMGFNYVRTGATMELRFSWASIMYVLVLQWSYASHGLQ